MFASPLPTKTKNTRAFSFTPKLCSQGVRNQDTPVAGKNCLVIFTKSQKQKSEYIKTPRTRTYLQLKFEFVIEFNFSKIFCGARNSSNYPSFQIKGSYRNKGDPRKVDKAIGVEIRKRKEEMKLTFRG
jgi:hypothetical protein